MGEKIRRHFVEDRAVVVDPLPFTWRVKGPGPHYCLDMKMSWLKQLAFAFEFGSVDPRQSFPVTEFPARIVKLDISLNELEELQPEALFAFESLSELDASLNALGGIPGIGVLPNLTVLNLSYNVLSDVRDLGSCTRLLVLNLSHNQVRTLEHMPLLSNLTRLHLGSNKLSSLDGVQHLPQLCELYIQRNWVSSLLPLSSSLALNVLDASRNKIACLQYTLCVLGGLRRLRHLKLQGNPLARDNHYAAAVKQATAVETLDDVLLRDPPRCSALSSFSWALLGESAARVMNSSQTKEDLKTSARRIFLERLQHKRDDTESAIHHLHSRILDLREDLAEYEDTLKTEMDGCVRYIDALPPKDFQGLTNPDTIPKAMEKFLFTKFWQTRQRGQRKPASLPYKALTKPDEVLPKQVLCAQVSRGQRGRYKDTLKGYLKQMEVNLKATSQPTPVPTKGQPGSSNQRRAQKKGKKRNPSLQPPFSCRKTCNFCRTYSFPLQLVFTSAVKHMDRRSTFSVIHRLTDDLPIY